jgi:hypothetical protein
VSHKELSTVSTTFEAHTLFVAPKQIPDAHSSFAMQSSPFDRRGSHVPSGASAAISQR